MITGASKPGQVHENMKAIDFVRALTTDVLERIDEVLANKPETNQDWR